MQLNLAIEQLARAKLSRPHGDLSLFVEVFSPGSIGTTPCVKVESLQVGIDWDAGRVLLSTDQPLRRCPLKTSRPFWIVSRMARVGTPTSHIKKQADRIKLLEAEVAGLKAGLLSK